jgi:hypothetical protein
VLAEDDGGRCGTRVGALDDGFLRGWWHGPEADVGHSKVVVVPGGLTASGSTVV